MNNRTLTCSIPEELEEQVHEREVAEDTQRRRLVEAALANYVAIDVALRNTICARAKAEGMSEGELMAKVMTAYLADAKAAKKTAKKKTTK